MTDEKKHEQRGEVPLELIEFVNSKHLRESLPIRFHFSDKEFILEIMCFFEPEDPNNFDTDLNYLRFARTGDGFVLLVDLNGETLEILQEEFGNVDYLNITINDLRKAEWESI